MKTYPVPNLDKLLELWGLQFGRVRDDILIAGSPDRCLFRTVIEEREGRLFILENLAPDTVNHKKKIAQSMVFLAKKGLSQVHPHLPFGEDNYISAWENRYWQVLPYVEGVSLVRPDYAFEGWRGPVLAGFLIDLWEKSKGLSLFDKSCPFSIVSFNRDFLKKLNSREPGLSERIRPSVEFLERKFVSIHDDLPVRFCHGDYHAMNVIWSAKGINAVIDWEFLGYKPEIYDIAMMIGCLGMEKPQSLTGDLVFEFVKRLKGSGLIAEISWSYLFEFVLALRFAWLSDWLRKSDHEMIDLEVVYIQLLLENRDVLIRSWKV